MVGAAAYLLIVQLGLHLAEAVCLPGLIAGGAGQEVEHTVAASAVVVVSGPGALQALGPVGAKTVRPPARQGGASLKATPIPL